MNKILFGKDISDIQYIINVINRIIRHFILKRCQ